MKTIDRSRLRSLMAREVRGFARRHPRSAALFRRALGELLQGRALW